MTNNQRGRGRGGAVRGGRGGSAPQANRGQAPVAAQLRQITSLTEADEVSLMRRLAPFGALRVRSEYSVDGLVSREVGVLNAEGTAVTWRPLGEFELVVAAAKRQQQQGTWEARIPSRFPPGVAWGPAPATYAGATQQQKDILEMSQAAWAAYLSQRGYRAGPNGLERLATSNGGQGAGTGSQDQADTSANTGASGSQGQGSTTQVVE